MAWLGYRYLDRQIPDELQISRGETVSVSALLDHPLVSFEEAIEVSADGSYTLPCKILGYIPFKSIKVTPVDDKAVYVSGSTVGIYLRTRGVLVVDTGEIQSQNGETKEPSKGIVKPGDYILSVKDSRGAYKLGLWVRDDTQGIGTLTYVDEQGKYGALGHGISDVDTAGLLDIQEGTLYKAQILAVSRGSRGNPGELAGMIRYDNSNVLGSIQENCKNGIYGQMNLSDAQKLSLVKMPVAHKQEIETGPALIRCSVDGQVKEYEAQIKRIDLNHEDSNKSFILQVTDEELLEKTGGVVQGMSGSPVIQNGKSAGAVTHVFVQDSTSGYGIFAETMMEHENYKMT